MAKRKIPPNLEPDVLARAAEGASTRAIAEWLGTQGVQVSHVAVAAYLRATRETRADVVRTVVQEKLRPHVVSDLDRLEEIRAEVAERRKKAVDEVGEDEMGMPMKGCSHLDFVRLATLEAQVIEKKLKLSGAGESDDAERCGVRVFLPPEED